MTIHKNRAILLFMIFVVFSDEADGNRRITNRKEKCTKPTVPPNAVLRPQYINKEKFEHNDTVEFNCDLGYSIEGISRVRRCRNGEWTEILFSCNEITCHWLPHPENGRYLDTSYTVGDIIQFKCNAGYKLRGNNKLLCRINGQWSPRDPPKCDPILCPSLPGIRNGQIFQDTSDMLANNYESVVEYTCDRDYYLNGNTQLRTITRTCQANGTWSGKEPFCEVPKCNSIKNFYGGHVEYFGGRELYSLVFYRCDENYSFVPNVRNSKCERNLQWSPPPPRCLGKADWNVPKNGYSPDEKRDKVLHGESYEVCCLNDFEIESDGVVPVEKIMCKTIRNNNGTLEPGVACVEEWCETEKDFTQYEYENGSAITTRIQSGTNVLMSCKDGYAIYNNRDELMPQPKKLQCIRGQIRNAPTCTEKKCTLEGYPYQKFTQYRDSKNNPITREQYIEPKETIEVYCSNEYELHVKEPKQYIHDFTSTCRHGRFDKEKREFPVCIEKRCDSNNLENAYATFETKSEVTTKIQSKTHVLFFCNKGFAIYDSDGRPVETPLRGQCMKGKFDNVPECQEAKCTLSGYPKNQNTNYKDLNLNSNVDIMADFIDSNHKIEVFCINAEQYELYVTATDKYIETFMTKCRKGKFKKGREDFPVCVERRCSIDPSKFDDACFFQHNANKCKQDQFYIQSGNSVQIRCHSGYKLNNSTDEVEDRGTLTCNKGRHTNFTCVPESCKAQKVNNTEPLPTETYKHSEKAKYNCKKGYWFNQSIIKNQKIFSLTTICNKGNWTANIPVKCEPVACLLVMHAGTEYYINGTTDAVNNTSFQDNGTSIEVRCKKSFDLVAANNTLINATNYIPVLTCHEGDWKNIHLCKKRCNIPNKEDVQFSKDGINLTINDTVKHMESVNVFCMDKPEMPSLSVQCVDGTFKQNDLCTADSDVASQDISSKATTITTKNFNDKQGENKTPFEKVDYSDEAYSDSSRQPVTNDGQQPFREENITNPHSSDIKGCKLSDDMRYQYFKMEGQEISPGDNVPINETLTVQCRFIDPMFFYDYYNPNDTYTQTDNVQISCKVDHQLTELKKECPEEEKYDDCLKVDNGSVKKSRGYFVVTCKDGFLLDIYEPEEKRFNCEDGKLKSIIGGQEPKCKPERCTVPYDYDPSLSIYINTTLSLSGGSVVEVGHVVFFNCSKLGHKIQEPFNRRFKCMNGRWVEDERDKSWEFGNNGTFPKCREAKCDCENGGICSKDDECKCKHLTSGKRCEKVHCEEKCHTNNGECIGPGQCKCPEGKHGTNCEESGCRFPEYEAMPKLRTTKIYFAPGDTVNDLRCASGYFLSSSRGMTCKSDGSWSDEVTCVKGLHYLISTKTGTRRYAGTDANVYITLIGSGGSTGKISFRGKFEFRVVDEIREYAKDIRPIQKVQIGHDGSGIWPDWYLEYVSIYVEHEEEFYVFRYNQWINEENDITLSREGPSTCINSFGKKQKWGPKWSSNVFFYLGHGSDVSLRSCKQRCINRSEKCQGIYYIKTDNGCYGFDKSDESNFYKDAEKIYGFVYLRQCLK